MPATNLNLLDEALLLLTPIPPSQGFPPDPFPGQHPNWVYVGRGAVKRKNIPDAIGPYIVYIFAVNEKGEDIGAYMMGNSPEFHYYIHKDAPNEIFEIFRISQPD